VRVRDSGSIIPAGVEKGAPSLERSAAEGGGFWKGGAR